jgi:VWFA-related protein
MLVIVAALAAGGLRAQRGQQPPVFRAGTEVVPVSVSVRSGRSFVRNLTTVDFELYDNGVRQEIRAMSADAFASDVTLVVDTSGSVVRSLSRFRSDVRKIAGALEPADRLRLLTFDTEVRQVFPMQDRGMKVPVEEIRTGDMTSLVDAVVFALARTPRPDRRHLIFVFTDGYDNASLMGYGALPELAARSDAVLHLVLVKVTGVPDETGSAAFDALETAARRTGGAYYPPGDDRPDVVDAFKEALDAFRHSYVLYFTPKGVAAPGWHRLTVKVTKTGNHQIEARQGYYGG